MKATVKSLREEFIKENKDSSFFKLEFNDYTHYLEQKLLHPTEVKEPSKSAEDILNPYIQTYEQPHGDWDFVLPKNALKAMETYAQQFPLSESKQIITEEEIEKIAKSELKKYSVSSFNSTFEIGKNMISICKEGIRKGLSLHQSVTNCNQTDSKKESEIKTSTICKPGILCMECKKSLAIVDYNGHGHLVCHPCNEKLNNEFDEEYK